MSSVIGQDWDSVEALFDSVFGERPSGQIVDLLRPIEQERLEVRAFLTRWLRFTARAAIPPRHIPPGQAWILATIIPGLLPGAWRNVVPPFTLEDRHIDIDRYLLSGFWNLPRAPKLLEMGCGFPPQTAVDTAKRFPAWTVVGADIRFDPYVVYDRDGNYACMDQHGRVRYFHPATLSTETYAQLYRDPGETFTRFEALFEQLVPLLPDSDTNGFTVVERDGGRLLRHPILSYERSNLRLIESGVGDDCPAVDVIRIFNVLLYFDAEFRRGAESWALRTLLPDGLFLVGADMGMTTEARYCVYRREDAKLVLKEFSFSLDNLRPFTVISWFALHDDDPETVQLARLVGLLRSTPRFTSAFDARFDALLEEERLWRRLDDGSLAAPEDQRPSVEWLAARLRMSSRLQTEGFVEEAVSILNAAGVRAWINAVGHIAVDPATMC